MMKNSQYSISQYSSVSNLQLLRLSLQFHRGGHRGGQAVLRVLSLLSFMVCSFASLILAGGMWAIDQRSLHPERISAELPESFAAFYPVLVGFALVFLIPAIMALSSSATVMSSAGQERRLATLRLLGVSRFAVIRLVLIETAVMVTIGYVIALLIFLGTSPLWSLVSLQGMPLSSQELLLPPKYYLLLWLALMGLAVYAAGSSLSQLVISPLGVAKKIPPPKLKSWRLWLGVAVVASTPFLLKFAPPQSALQAYVVTLLILLPNLLIVFFVIPWIIQSVARLSQRLPGRVHFLVTRRIAAKAKTIWKRVSTPAFLSILMGFTLHVVEWEGTPGLFTRDIRTGVILTCLIGFVLSFVSMLLAHAQTILQEAELERSLVLMGVPRNYLGKVALFQMTIPLIGTCILGYLFGYGLSLAVGLSPSDSQSGGNVLVLALFIGSVALLSCSSLFLEPLRRKVISQMVRAND